VSIQGRAACVSPKHSGAIDAHPGAMEAHPGAMEAHPAAVELTLKPWRLTLETWNPEPWRLALEPWRLTRGHGGSSCSRGAHPEALQALPRDVEP
jgi:hypothetical protein